MITHVSFKADPVFLDDEEEREECVMNELGIIYHGAYDDVSERAWNYGQVCITFAAASLCSLNVQINVFNCTLLSNVQE